MSYRPLSHTPDSLKPHPLKSKYLFTLSGWTDRTRWTGRFYIGGGLCTTPDSLWPCTVSGWSWPPPSAARTDNKAQISLGWKWSQTQSLHRRGYTPNIQCLLRLGWRKWTSGFLTPSSRFSSCVFFQLQLHTDYQFRDIENDVVVSDDWKPKVNFFAVKTVVTLDISTRGHPCAIRLHTPHMETIIYIKWIRVQVREIKTMNNLRLLLT